MTAVDHAELKRLAEDVLRDQASGILHLMADADQAFYEAAKPETVLALLSEIEGLKAERDRLKLAICGGEDVPGSINAVSVDDCERFIREERSRHDWSAEQQAELDSLRTQAPDSWRPDREAINAAIEDADKRLAYGMELIKLVDGDHTYRLKIDGQTLFFTDSETEEWNAQDRLYEHIRKAKNRIRADAVIAGLRPQTAESGKCGRCFNCLEAERDPTSGFPIAAMRMIVCPDCGNKRCPKATSHDNQCTGSNEPGQAGSRYA